MKRKINESLLRSNSKRQMEELNRTIKKSGGDIQDIVRKSEKTKEDKMPNAYYMDNPFDAKRRSIDTWEEFSTGDAHYKSTAMKSREPKTNKKDVKYTDMKLSTMKMNESNNKFDFIDVSDWLEYIYDWTYIEHEGQNRIRYDWMNNDYSLWLNDDGTVDGKIPKEIKKELLSKGVILEDNLNETIFINKKVDVPEKDIQDAVLAVKNWFESNPDKKQCNVSIFGYSCWSVEKGSIEEDIRQCAEIAIPYNKIEESKKFTTKFKKENIKDKKVCEPKLKNLKSFYQICNDSPELNSSVCKTKSNINDDTWVKGTNSELRRPMFKNLPDTTVRTSYDTLRAGQWVKIFGLEGRINGLKNGKVLIDIIDKDNKLKTVSYTFSEVLKELKKSSKNDKS